MDIFAVTAFCIVAAILCVVLRQYKPEYAAMLSIACSAAVIIYLMTSVTGIVREMSSLFGGMLISNEMLALVLKCLGVCILAELASQTCRDAGEAAIAGKIELAAKVALVVISLPLFSRVLEIASRLLRL